MKNCQIVIKRKDHRTVTFTFNDFRIAQAIINILDNVAEPLEIDGEVDLPGIQHIHKQIYEE